MLKSVFKMAYQKLPKNSNTARNFMCEEHVAHTYFLPTTGSGLTIFMLSSFFLYFSGPSQKSFGIVSEIPLTHRGRSILFLFLFFFNEYGRCIHMSANMDE